MKTSVVKRAEKSRTVLTGTFFTITKVSAAIPSVERLRLFEFTAVDEAVVAHKEEGVAHDEEVRKEQQEEER